MAITENESVKRVNLNLKDLNSAERAKAKKIAGEIIVDEINSFLDDSESPVEGGKFKAKKEDGEDSELFEDGFLRNAIEHRSGDGDFIEVGVFENADNVERLKAFAHNTGFRGHPFLANRGLEREFIPDTDQDFKERIMKRVDREINNIRKQRPPSTLAEQFNVAQFLTDSDIIESVLEVTGINLEDFI